MSRENEMPNDQETFDYFRYRPTDEVMLDMDMQYNYDQIENYSTNNLDNKEGIIDLASAVKFLTERQDDIKTYPPNKDLFGDFSSEDRLASIYEMVAKSVDIVSYNHGEDEYKSNITAADKTSPIEHIRAGNQRRIIESMKNGDLNTIIKENFSNYQNQLANELGTDKTQSKMQDDFANQIREINAEMEMHYNEQTHNEQTHDTDDYILDEMTVDEVPILLEKVNEKTAKSLTISPSEIDQLNISIQQAYHQMSHDHAMGELKVYIAQGSVDLLKNLRENMNVGLNDKDIPAYAEKEIGTKKTYDEVMDEYVTEKTNFDEKVLYDKETLFDTVYALQTYNFNEVSGSNKRNPVLITEETKLLLGDDYKQFCDDKFNQKLDNLEQKHTEKSLFGIDVTKLLDDDSKKLDNSKQKDTNKSLLGLDVTKLLGDDDKKLDNVEHTDKSLFGVDVTKSNLDEKQAQQEAVSEPVSTPQKSKGRSVPSEFEDLAEQDLAKGDTDYLPKD